MFVVEVEGLTSSWELWPFLHSEVNPVPWEKLEKIATQIPQLNAIELLKGQGFKLYTLLISEKALFLAIKRTLSFSDTSSLISVAKADYLSTTMLPLVEKWLAPLLAPQGTRAFLSAGSGEEGITPIIDEKTSPKRVSQILIEIVPKVNMNEFIARSFALTALRLYQTKAQQDNNITPNLWYSEAYKACLYAFENFFETGFFDLSYLSDFHLFWDLRNKACQKLLIKEDFSPYQSAGTISFDRLFEELNKLFSSGKVCSICGKKILLRRNQKYCSDNCRQRANRIIRKLQNCFSQKPSSEEAKKFLESRRKFSKKDIIIPYDLPTIIEEAFRD
ncbi:hypothetical protein Thein_1501 [Thermodesulfatator indicus DSM 15286]|uniref:Uncharacterized protein n=1 Tax=Thermodesulfatator indicus (strain DSM 15286 / JCM 11887 / CIR29812) TaxID=667014 RepID=F8AAE2_THEID|nr:hypothetical protein [Thermodesulfatator indicus]AEH45362.1 hypothetical protein Thein_1501 [Thermodesulfatator indicus DSM 15286]